MKQRPCTQAERNGIHSPLPLGRQVFSHLQRNSAPTCVTLTWEDKYHHSQRSPPSFLLPHLYMLSMMSYDMGYAWGQLFQLCPLPSLLADG